MIWSARDSYRRQMFYAWRFGRISGVDHREKESNSRHGVHTGVRRPLRLPQSFSLCPQELASQPSNQRQEERRDLCFTLGQAHSHSGWIHWLSCACVTAGPWFHEKPLLCIGKNLVLAVGRQSWLWLSSVALDKSLSHWLF
jgi:hypothetical protein